MRVPLVISGAGVISPLGATLAETHAAVQAGRVGLAPYTQLEQNEAATRLGLRGGECPGLTGVPPERRAIEGLARAVGEALASARLDKAAWPFDPARCGVALGTTLHGMPAHGSFLRTGDKRALRGFNAGCVLHEALADLPFRGPRITCSAACASGLGALGWALSWLESGLLDCVLCGGYDPLSEYAVGGFNALRVVAPDAVRCFAKGRQGMMVAEGFALFVLERAPSAAARGAAVLGQVAATGEASDAHHLTQPRPDGSGAAAAIRAAMARAAAAPGDIDLACAHATGTRDNDGAEAAAYRATLDGRAVPIVGLKSRLGHTLGAAGALESALGLCALADGRAPTTAHLPGDEVEPQGLNILTGPPQALERRETLLVTSLGFGGADAAAVFHRTPRPLPPLPAARPVTIRRVGAAVPGHVGPGIGPVRTGLVDDAALAPWLDARRARRVSRLSLLALAAARATLNGSKPGAPELADLTVVVGTTQGSTRYACDYYNGLIKDGLGAANPLLFAEGVPNSAAAHISMDLGARGPAQALVGTVSCGLDAIGHAARRVASGEWPRALVVVAEEDSEVVRDVWRHLDAPPEGPAMEGAVGFLLEPAGPGDLALDARHGTRTPGPGPVPANLSLDTVLALAEAVRDRRPGRFRAEDPTGEWAEISLGVLPL